jgi:rSAM-associated Gly-rich repeat protein
MTHSHRRQFLKDFLGALAQTAGTIVLASATTARALARGADGQNEDIQKRAEELSEAAGANKEDLQVNFSNSAFRNVRAGGGGGFRNGGFANGGGGGAFRNGGFANGGGYGGGGAFRNGAFRNF